MSPPKKTFRCAIYTRKSTDHNLDLEFNSLDAQREACEAYIKSQAHEGWRLIPDHYDDGAYSGASLERPALQRLLIDLEANKVDIVVVYKVDRLTRSLADFAKLVDLFDARSVSFVSVTQSFNTTSSMGRLTLNVLLSFAQFEREVIGERVRDKIAASKRKGLWVGGPVPLGYASINKKLVILPDEVETVRLIFRRYLELGSVRTLAGDLDRRGITTKQRRLSTGRVVGGGRFGLGGLNHLLRNRFYIGEIAYRGEIHLGDHEPILDRDLFEAVQAKLSSLAVARRLKTRSTSALLTGRLFDELGNRMTPSHTVKKGVRYRYYVCSAQLQRKSAETGCAPRVSATEIEALVMGTLRKHLADVSADLHAETSGDRDLVERHIERIVVSADAIEISLSPHAGVPTQNAGSVDDEVFEGKDADGQKPVVLRLPWTTQSRTIAKGITHRPAEAASLKPETKDALLTAIAKARSWIDEIVGGHMTSLDEIAHREGKGERHIRLLAPLAFLSPQYVRAIMDGIAPADITVSGLAKQVADSWVEQHRQTSGRMPDCRFLSPSD